MAVNHKNKIAIKQQKVRGTNQACERSREVPEIVAVTAVFNHQAAAPQAPRRLQDSSTPNRQEIDTVLACSITQARNALLSFYQL